jgi:hypothetical protein
MAVRGRSGGDATQIAALAGGATYEAAAKQAGVSEWTVRRRLDNADFRRQVDEARAELLEQAMAQLSRAATGAATTLVMLLAKDVPATVRLGASRAILDTLLRWREQASLAERLDRVEAWLDTVDAEAKTDGTPGGWRWRG